MKNKNKILLGDTALWVIYFLLSGISLIAVYSTIGYSAIVENSSTPSHIFFKHLIFVVLSYLVIILISHLNYRHFAKLSLYAYAFTIILLIIAFFIGKDGRWIEIGHTGFQPSELAKIVLMVFLARSINANRESLDKTSSFLLTLLPVLVACLIIAPKNLSTAILIFIASYLLLYFGGADRKLWWKGFGLLAVAGAILLIGAYFLGDTLDIARSSTWSHRLQAWVNPDPNELTQENMARMAIARGGLTGTGIGTTVYGRLMTQAHNDFIYAIIIEEKGLLIAAIPIFLLYAWFYFRCIRIATHCHGLFGRLCVAGIGTLLYLQAIVNMSVAVGLLPVTGQTLPFISFGGSAYIFLGLGIGVIQAVASDNKKQKLKEEKIINEVDEVAKL